MSFFKKLLGQKKLPIFKSDDTTITTVAEELPPNQSSTQKSPQEDTSDVPHQQIEEISQFLEYQSRRYDKELTI